MDFLNIIKDKIDSTKDYLVNTFVEDNDTLEPQYERRGREKEINYNHIESKKVKYIKQATSYELKLQINGKSIFENLVLTAQATQNNEPVPIKCHWKRIYEETIITIQDINSFSYMPNAEDIGYKIEIEVSSLDDPEDVAIAQYGPIIIDKDMENAIELFLTSGKSFNLFLFDPNTQEKVKDKEFILYLKNDELILSNYGLKGKENILEKCLYSQMNPIIKLSPTNVNKINFTFIDYDSNDNNQIVYENNFNNKNEEIVCKKKTEYEFVAMSKQNRELIYLLIQFFVIDEKIKNNKLFTLINHELIPTNEKLGLTDLVGELNILKKENLLVLNDMNALNEINNKLSDNYKELENNFMTTLSQINEKNSYIQETIYKANKKSNKNYMLELSNSCKKNNEWKKKYDALNNSYNLMLFKHKELELNKTMLLNKENDSNLKLKNNNDNLNTLKGKNDKLKKEINEYNEKLKKAKEEYNNIKSKYESFKTQLNKLKEENNGLIKKNKEDKDVDKNKNEITKTKKNNEKLNEENKSLLKQRDLLNKQKSELSKELQKHKKEKDTLQKQYDDLQGNINNSILSSSLSSKNKELNELKQINSSAKDKLEKLKKEYNILNSEHKKLKELNEKGQNSDNLNTSRSAVSSVVYQMSPEEYEEYEILRKNKDENEALIMQLKSNCQAKEVEKKELREILRKLEKKK